MLFYCYVFCFYCDGFCKIWDLLPKQNIYLIYKVVRYIRLSSSLKYRITWPLYKVTFTLSNLICMTRLKRKYSGHTLNSNFENSIKLINIGSSGNLFLIRYPLATFLDILILRNDLYVIRINYFSWKCVRENEMISWFVFSFGGYNLSWDFDP